MSSLTEDQIMSGSKPEENEENDEEKQEELRDYSKNKFECKLTLDEAAIPANSTVLICKPGAPTALARILHSSSWKEIGKVETTYHEKTETSLTVYVDGSVTFILIDGSLASLFCGNIIAQLWPIFTAKNCSYLGLSSVYKNNYSTFEGHMSIDSDQPLPLRYVRSSNGAALVEAIVKQKAWGEHIMPCN